MSVQKNIYFILKALNLNSVEDDPALQAQVIKQERSTFEFIKKINTCIVCTQALYIFFSAKSLTIL